MPFKIDADRFVQGRDAYVQKVPLLEFIGRVAKAGEENDDHGAAMVFGFLDGALADLRDCAQNAREEMEGRRV